MFKLLLLGERNIIVIHRIRSLRTTALQAKKGTETYIHSIVTFMYYNNAVL